jgi:hypothetical protein
MRWSHEAHSLLRRAAVMIIYYASRTGTRKTLTHFARLGFRLMLSAYGVANNQGFPFAIDNGAWSAFKSGETWKADSFIAVVASHGASADFIVAPDVVGQGDLSSDLSMQWIPRLRGIAPIYFAMQDGHDSDVISEAHSAGFSGVFVGGTTAWKLDNMGWIAGASHDHGMRCHVGRVNSARRIHRCIEAGADSCDGSGPTLYTATAEIVAAAIRQGGFSW